MMIAICKEPNMIRSIYDPPVLNYATMNCKIVNSSEKEAPPDVPAAYLQDVVKRFFC